MARGKSQEGVGTSASTWGDKGKAKKSQKEDVDGCGIGPVQHLKLGSREKKVGGDIS